jgi:hypothetical protein
MINRQKIIEHGINKGISYRSINRKLLSSRLRLLSYNERNNIDKIYQLYNERNKKIKFNQIKYPSYLPQDKKKYKPNKYIKNIAVNYDKLPIIDVIIDSRNKNEYIYTIVDGFHRYEAMIFLKKRIVYVNVLKKMPKEDHPYWYMSN